MDKNLPIMDKAEEMSLLQYAMTVTEAYTQNEMRNRWCYAIHIRAICGSKCYAAGVCRSMPEYPNLYIAFL